MMSSRHLALRLPAPPARQAAARAHADRFAPNDAPTLVEFLRGRGQLSGVEATLCVVGWLTIVRGAHVVTSREVRALYPRRALPDVLPPLRGGAESLATAAKAGLREAAGTPPRETTPHVTRTVGAPMSADACTHGCPLAGVGRREFISQTVLAAAALALAACGGGGSDGATAPTSVASSLRVADYPALAAVGGVALVTVSGARLAIVRTGASSFVALSRVCPHQGNIVNVSAEGFLCPGHGARFNSVGTWIGGQQTTSLRSYGTTYDAAAGTLAIG